MREQAAVFKEKLQQFALKHKKDINKDPVLRKRFHEMCQSIGVDPLASNKGFWGQILGVGDFYYELGVQIIDVCLRTRHKNGGYLELSALRDHLNATRPKGAQPVTLDDLERSISKLKVLGGNFAVAIIGVPPNECKMVLSVPPELNPDTLSVLQVAREKNGHVSQSDVQKALKWDLSRCERALEKLEHEGIAWIDHSPSGDTIWYMPSLIPELLG